MCLDISIIIPLYNSGIRIPLLYQPITRVLCFCNSYEIILIDDGSKDNTMQLIKELKEKDPRVRIVQLKEKRGQYEALLAGYKCSKGKMVISLDDDAFREIDYIPEFLRKIEEDGYDVVLGWRKKEGYPFLRRLLSFLFNALISLIVGRRIHDIGSSLKSRNRKVADKMISLGNPVSLLPYRKNYRVTEIRIPSSCSKRFHSRYNIFRLIKAAFEIFWNSVFIKNLQNSSRESNYIEIN